MPAVPAATAVQSLRGTEDMDDEHKADFLFSISKGHQVSWMPGCVEMTFSKAWDLKKTDITVLPVVCIFQFKMIICAMTRKYLRKAHYKFCTWIAV